MTKEKARLYKTAYAAVSCAHFQKGDCVSVEFVHVGNNGLMWFHINKTQHGKLPYPVAYHDKMLTDFSL